MADKKSAQTTDSANTTPAAGNVEIGKAVDALISAPIQDEVGSPMKGSQVPPMKQPKNLG